MIMKQFPLNCTALDFICHVNAGILQPVNPSLFFRGVLELSSPAASLSLSRFSAQTFCMICRGIVKVTKKKMS